jgi:anthranilate phosphoribosyltransferase
MFTTIIAEKEPKLKTMVCANAAMAIATVTNCSPLEGFQIAKESFII